MFPVPHCTSLTCVGTAISRGASARMGNGGTVALDTYSTYTRPVQSCQYLPIWVISPLVTPRSIRQLRAVGQDCLNAFELPYR
jgi:hypothetical protein